MALFDHQVVQQRHGASKGPTVETFTQDVQTGMSSSDILRFFIVFWVAVAHFRPPQTLGLSTAKSKHSKWHLLRFLSNSPARQQH
jgi:hypothetical protein